MIVPFEEEYVNNPENLRFSINLHRLRVINGWILQSGPARGPGGAFVGHASVFVHDPDHGWDISEISWDALEKGKNFRTAVPGGWIVMGLDRARGRTRDGEEMTANSCNLTFVPDEEHQWEVEHK